MKKNFIVLLLIIILSSFSFVNYVEADNIFGNDDETVEKFDYESEDEDSTDDETEEEVTGIGSVDKDEESNHSVGLILVEVFCGIIGLIMLFLAFKTNDS